MKPEFIWERSYGGRYFRPTPEIKIESEQGLALIATPWGPRAAADKVIQSVHDFLLSVRRDREVTSPFQKMTCLSPIANNLRMAVMLANDSLHRETNSEELIAGVELCALHWSETECVFAQVGFPQIFLDRHEDYLVGLSPNQDLATSHTKALKKTLAPLPGSALGIYGTSQFQVQSFRPQPGDRLVLVSRSFVPPQFLGTPRNNRNLETLSMKLAKENPELPFWISSLSLPQGR